MGHHSRSKIISKLNEAYDQGHVNYTEGLITDVEFLNVIHELVFLAKSAIKENIVGQLHDLEGELKDVSLGIN